VFYLTESTMNIVAVIMAAGGSQRMGQTKQSMLIDGQPMLARVVDTVVAGLRQVIVVLGSSADQIEPLLAGKPVTIVINPDWREGIASSLRAGLAQATPDVDAALFVPADMPRLKLDTIRVVIARFQDTGKAIVVPTYGGQRGNPALFARTLFPELLALRGDRGGRALFASHQADMEMIEVDDPGILIDIDTPDDYRRLPQ
jgi:molybdenum cofactor cytidylyltransferase